MTELKLETIAKMVMALAKETNGDPLEILEFLEGSCWNEEEADHIQLFLEEGYAAQERERRFKMYLELKEEFGEFREHWKEGE